MQHTKHPETTTLPNGIQIHYFPRDVEFSLMRIALPFGSVHNIAANDIMPGTAHYLEHIHCNRSQAFPEYKAFDHFVTLAGGHQNAHTSAYQTVYFANLPTAHFAEGWRGLFSQVFEPFYQQEDFDRERTIILSERSRKAKYYPGSDEVSQHLHREWLHDELFSLDQLFGTEDLDHFTPAYLQTKSPLYHRDGIHVFLGGRCDVELVTNTLALLKLESRELAQTIIPLTWVNPQYREEEWTTIQRSSYFMAGLINEPLAYETRVAIWFLTTFFVNFAHGPLYQWLRHEQGWCYDVYRGVDTRHQQAAWRFEVPVTRLDIVPAIREQFLHKLEQPLADASWLAAEVERRIGSKVFWYQELGSVLDQAVDEIDDFDRIIPDEEWEAAIRRCANPKYVQQIFKKYFLDVSRGEYLAVAK